MAAISPDLLAEAGWSAPTGYLNTALRGLPPRASVDAAHRVIDKWGRGALDWVGWLDQLIEIRERFAALVGVAPHRVGVGHTAASLVGIVAANLSQGSRILVLDHEHNSNTIPFRHSGKGLVLDPVAPRDLLPRLAEGGYAAVAISAVQSSDGTIADLPALRELADKTGALLCVDATQALGWYPVAVDLCDVLVSASYKWLMGPNGPSFIVVREALIERLRPLAPNWFACVEPHAAPYGVDFELARDARRFDVVPGLISIAGLLPSLDLLQRIGIATVCAHNVGLAAQVRAELRLPESGSAIVAFERPGAGERLQSAGLVVTTRGHRVRLAFHIYSRQADVDAVIAVLGGAEAPLSKEAMR